MAFRGNQLTRVESSIEIGVSPATAFEYVADHRNALRWMHGFSRFDPIEGGAAGGLGAQVRATGLAFGIPVSTTLRVVTYEPGARLVSESDGRIRSSSSWTFTELTNGTRVVFAASFDLPSFLVRLVGPETIHAELTKNAERSLENLKQNLEAMFGREPVQ